MSHELASPLTALHTFLRLAKGDGLAPIGACVKRIEAVVELTRELSHLEEPSDADATDLVLAFESAAARLGMTIAIDATGPMVARMASKRAVLVATALLRSVHHHVRLARRDDQIWIHVGPEPQAWRVVDPWESGTGFKLDLWAVAVATGAEVRVGDVEGELAVELDLEAR